MGKARAEIIIEHASVSKADNAVKSLTTDLGKMGTKGERSAQRASAKMKQLTRVTVSHTSRVRAATAATSGLGRSLAALALPAALLMQMKDFLAGVKQVRNAGLNASDMVRRNAVLAGTSAEVMVKRLRRLSGGLVDVPSAGAAHFAAFSAVPDNPEVAREIARQAIKAQALDPVHTNAGEAAAAIGEIVKKRKITTAAQVRSISSLIFGGAEQSKAGFGRFATSQLDWQAISGLKMPGKQLSTVEAQAIFERIEKGSPDTEKARIQARTIAKNLMSPKGKDAKAQLKKMGVTPEMGMMRAVEAIQKYNPSFREIGKFIDVRAVTGAAALFGDYEGKSRGALGRSITRGKGDIAGDRMGANIKRMAVSDPTFTQKIAETTYRNALTEARVEAAGADVTEVERAQRLIRLRAIKTGKGESGTGDLSALVTAPWDGVTREDAIKMAENVPTSSSIRDKYRDKGDTGLMLPQKVEIVNPDDAGRGPGARP